MIKVCSSLILLLFLVLPCRAQKYLNLAPTPPMGWNSWNTFAGDINENLIKGMAESLVESGMQKAGYKYVVLDDCWSAKERDKDGNLVADPKKFPSGMKALGDFLHERGFKFGIYNCAGTKTCAGYPGGHTFEEKDALMYASWGVDYLKYDWCNTEGANAQERYTKMRDALHAAGRPIVFSMCEWGQSKPWLWADDVSHLWRTTGDIGPCWDCKNRWTTGWKTLLDAQVGLEKYAGPDHWNDPDMMQVGNKGLNFAESRAHFSLWCMLAAPLMAGNDIRSMTPEIRDLLTDAEVLAIDQDPLGKQGFRFLAEANHEIWAKPLQGDNWAVCVLNTSANKLDFKLHWPDLTFLHGKQYTVRDLWRKETRGQTDVDLNESIDSHDVVLLHLTLAD